MVEDGFIPYGRHSITDDDVAAVERVLRSEWLTTGPMIDEFEDRLCEATGAADAVALSSGTAALHATYSALELKEGDELLCSPLTFAATAYPALHLKATVRFADVDETLTLDKDALATEITDRTKIVAVVDFAGHPADLDPLNQIAQDAGAILVEDASHSLGAKYKGRKVGEIAPLTIFSFHPVKTITTAEGGAVVMTDSRWKQPILRFRNHGLVRNKEDLRDREMPDWHQEIQALGLNYRLSDVHAALGVSQLRRLSSIVQERNRLAANYQEALSDLETVSLPVTAEYATPAWHLFTIRIKDGRRDALFQHLRERGIGAQVHYLPVHHHPLFQDLGYRKGICPRAERAATELLSIPLFPGLTDQQQQRVVTELRVGLGA